MSRATLSVRSLEAVIPPACLLVSTPPPSSISEILSSQNLSQISSACRVNTNASSCINNLKSSNSKLVFISLFYLCWVELGKLSVNSTNWLQSKLLLHKAGSERVIYQAGRAVSLWRDAGRRGCCWTGGGGGHPRFSALGQYIRYHVCLHCIWIICRFTYIHEHTLLSIRVRARGYVFWGYYSAKTSPSFFRFACSHQKKRKISTITRPVISRRQATLSLRRWQYYQPSKYDQWPNK